MDIWTNKTKHKHTHEWDRWRDTILFLSFFYRRRDTIRIRTKRPSHSWLTVEHFCLTNYFIFAQRIVSKYTVECFGFVHSCCLQFNLVCSYTWVRLYVHVCSIHMHTAYRSYLSLSLFVYWIVLFHAKLTKPSSVKSTKLYKRIRWRLFVFFWEYNLFNVPK